MVGEGQGSVSDPRDTRLEKMRWGYRRVEVPFEGSQGKEGAVVPYVDGQILNTFTFYLNNNNKSCIHFGFKVINK